MKIRNLWYWFRRKFILVRAPKIIPENTVLVLTVYENRITGWQTPDSARERTTYYGRGASFVCLTQDAIDQFIPAHSREVDEEVAEQREWQDRRDEEAAELAA